MPNNLSSKNSSDKVTESCPKNKLKTFKKPPPTLQINQSVKLQMFQMHVLLNEISRMSKKVKEDK